MSVSKDKQDLIIKIKTISQDLMRVLCNIYTLVKRIEILRKKRKEKRRYKIMNIKF